MLQRGAVAAAKGGGGGGSADDDPIDPINYRVNHAVKL